MKRKKIIVQPYGMTVMFIQSDDPNEMIRFFRRCGFPEKDNDFEVVYAHTLLGKYDDEDCIFLVFNLNDKYPIDAGVIAHECLHATLYINLLHNVVLSTHQSEPSCYMIGYLVDEVCKFLTGAVMQIKKGKK